MKKETITTGKTVEEAKEAASQFFGVPADRLTVEVIRAPKKGFLGFGEAPAEIKATYESTPVDLGVSFVRTLLSDMNIEAEISVCDSDIGKRINIVGDSASVLIGHHGETLDQLQYLVNLAANRKESEEDDRQYVRITLDIEGYRTKREETLKNLARRMANKALRYDRSVALEPMSAYERRIIHSEIQKLEGVSTRSIGAENNRRVIIFPIREDEYEETSEYEEASEEE
jgi:spoIIIJ-associated protein